MESKSRSLPPTTQLESSFQNSSMEARMPLTQTQSPDSNTPNHDYATPLELEKEMQALKKDREANGHRKKNCVLYESTAVKARKSSSEEDFGGVHIVHRHDKLFRILFFLLFILVITSICISVLSLIGFKLKENDKTCKCPTLTVPVYSAATKANISTTITKPVTESVFEARLLNLEENVVPALKQRIIELERNLNLTANKTVIGPPGPPGPDGPPGPVGDRGPAGQSNMQLCRPKTSSVRSALTTPFARIFASTDHVQASPGYVMLGSACSTRGAAEYSLFTDKNGNSTSYFCTCAGKATTEALSPTTMELVCRITWWECPLA